MSISACWNVRLPTLLQLLLVNRSLSVRVGAGGTSYDFKRWIATAMPLVMVGGFYSLLAYSDAPVTSR